MQIMGRDEAVDEHVMSQRMLMQKLSQKHTTLVDQFILYPRGLCVSGREWTQHTYHVVMFSCPRKRFLACKMELSTSLLCEGGKTRHMQALLHLS